IPWAPQDRACSQRSSSRVFGLLMTHIRSVALLFPVELLAKKASSFHRTRSLFAEDMAKTFEMQLVYPVFHREFPLLLGIRPRANQAVRVKAQAFGHFDVVLIQPAQLLRFGPGMALTLIAHTEVDEGKTVLYPKTARRL